MVVWQHISGTANSLIITLPQNILSSVTVK